MSGSDDRIRAIRRALKSFSFSMYGFDELDEVMADPSLDLLEALAVHIYNHLDD